MSDNKDELPGFYRDPKTGKYYREKPGDVGNPSFKKLKKEIEDEKFARETSKKPNVFASILKYNRAKELGQITGLQVEREYLKMRMCNKFVKQEVSLNDVQPHNIASVEFIKGGKTSVFGVWNIVDNGESRFVVGEQPFLGFPDNSNLGFKPCLNYIVDLCEGPNDTLLCLYNTLQGLGCYLYIPRVFEHSVDTYFVHYSSITQPLFCCSTASASKYALGSDGFISLYNNRFIREKIYFVNGRIHTISFNERSNLMVSGAHNGHLYVHDIRQKELQAGMKVSSSCLNDSYIVDQDQVIVAGVNDKLFKVDLRMKNVVTEYFGHKHSTKKRPFSVASGMVCATGADNVTRIWHLSGGNTVHEMGPLNNPDNEIRSWLHSDHNKTYLYHFEEHWKKIFEIF